VVVSKGGLTASRSLTGLFLPVGVGVALLVGLTGGAVLTRRNGWHERLVWGVNRAWAFARRLPRTALGTVVVGARLTADLVGKAVTAGRTAVETVREFVQLVPRPAALAARLHALWRGLLTYIGALPDRVRAGAARARARVDGSADGSGTTASTAPAAAAAGTDQGQGDDDAFDVREAWAWFVQQVPVRNPGATTPGEYARRGIERGFPADAVRTLTRAFRETTYSRGEPDERTAQAARDAYRRLREDGGEDR
jgi:hypothetical protein